MSLTENIKEDCKIEYGNILLVLKKNWSNRTYYTIGADGISRLGVTIAQSIFLDALAARIADRVTEVRT